MLARQGFGSPFLPKHVTLNGLVMQTVGMRTDDAEPSRLKCRCLVGYFWDGVRYIVDVVIRFWPQHAFGGVQVG